MANSRNQWVLAAGAALGVTLAAYGVTGRSASATNTLPDGAVAVVNGKTIAQADYDRALAAVAADRRETDLTPAIRQRVLDRLIDEELLVQRGIELDLATRDRRVRADLSAAVIDLLATRGSDDSQDPTEEQLRAFYEEQGDTFRTSTSVQLAQLFFAVGARSTETQALARAKAAVEQLQRGIGIEEISTTADVNPLPAPAGWLPVTKLQDYLGPTAAQAVSKMSPGELSDPMRTTSGVLVIRMLDRRLGDLPAFDRIRESVRAEYVRRAGERGLRDFLEERREGSEIRIAKVLP